MKLRAQNQCKPPIFFWLYPCLTGSDFYLTCDSVFTECLLTALGPSIYNALTEGEGVSGSGRHMRTGEEFSSTWTSTQKIFKLEPTDVILSSSHANLVFLDLNFIFRRNKKWRFFFNIYILVLYVRPTNSTVLN